MLLKCKKILDVFIATENLLKIMVPYALGWKDDKILVLDQAGNAIKELNGVDSSTYYILVGLIRSTWPKWPFICFDEDGQMLYNFEMERDLSALVQINKDFRLRISGRKISEDLLEDFRTRIINTFPWSEGKFQLSTNSARTNYTITSNDATFSSLLTNLVPRSNKVAS